jgi:hypothetical protein
MYDFYQIYIKTILGIPLEWLNFGIKNVKDKKLIACKVNAAIAFIIINISMFDLTRNIYLQQWNCFTPLSAILGVPGYVCLYIMITENLEYKQIHAAFEKYKKVINFIVEKIKNTGYKDISQFENLMKKWEDDFKNQKFMNDLSSLVRSYSHLRGSFSYRSFFSYKGAKRNIGVSSVYFYILGIIFKAIMFKSTLASSRFYIGTNSVINDLDFEWRFRETNIKEYPELLELKGVLFNIEGEFKEARKAFRKLYKIYNRKLQNKDLSAEEREDILQKLSQLRERVKQSYQEENEATSWCVYCIYGKPHSKGKIEEAGERLKKMTDKILEKSNWSSEMIYQN